MNLKISYLCLTPNLLKYQLIGGLKASYGMLFCIILTYEVIMTAQELYDALNKAGIDFEIIEIFDGSRLLRVEIDDSEIDEGAGQ